jgi:hypothetical protein
MISRLVHRSSARALGPGERNREVDFRAALSDDDAGLGREREAELDR